MRTDDQRNIRNNDFNPKLISFISVCDQSRGKDAPEYSQANISGDLSNFVKNSESFISKNPVAESSSHTWNYPDTFHFVPFGMSIDLFFYQ